MGGKLQLAQYIINYYFFNSAFWKILYCLFFFPAKMHVPVPGGTKCRKTKYPIFALQSSRLVKTAAS